jgi:response regulator RpfG family c-di-GMP phosphodiesterase
MPTASFCQPPKASMRPAFHYPTRDLPTATGQLLEELLRTSLVVPEDWNNLPLRLQEALKRCPNTQSLLCQLVDHQLITPYLANRIAAGKTFGLVLGNYRVLDRLGAGGMGVVFKGEHIRMRREVAIKVLSLSADQDPKLRLRFDTEVRAVARLRHPNIVAAFDTGEATSADMHEAVLHYYVMEYVEGQNLEDLVLDRGPLPVARACDLAYQVASALDEANLHRLVHRDIKPSNILVTPRGQAKLLDFGLSRTYGARLTEPGIPLGTVDYMAPEQARDASTVDIRADLYGLGGTLFWCLTGQAPFTAHGSIFAELMHRQQQAPPMARVVRPDLPPELDAVLARMMALNPDDRYPNPQAVMRAMLPFLHAQGLGSRSTANAAEAPAPAAQALEASPGSRTYQVLIVDDEPEVRRFCRFALQGDEFQCDEAADGELGLAAAQSKAYDLILLDVDMPRMKGTEMLRALREQPPCPNLKVLLLSGRAAADDLAPLLQAGADDYLCKPFSIVQLLARIRAALRLKDAQDRSDTLHRHLLAVNCELEQNLSARDSDLVHVRNALVLALAKLVEGRTTHASGHMLRMQRYVRFLAEEAATTPAFAGLIDGNFIQMLECCAPLHDIGNVGLPDHILLKPGKLEPEERIIMQSHTINGAETLQNVARHHGKAVAFLQMAIDVARHHHERFDGTGYPDRLGGSDIPLAARIVTLCDVYDALRSRRAHRPALSHATAVQMMTETGAGQFDPLLLEAFQRCASLMERSFQEFPDGSNY